MIHSHEEHHNDSHVNLLPGRLEAFSDGVLAIIITITVLELKIPTGSSLSVLRPLIPLFVTYLISFQTIGTYWNNHHHLIRATKHISSDIMWANLNLLFWLSLIPFVAGWLGANHGGAVPTSLYSMILLLCSISYSILQFYVIKHAENREQLIKEFNKSKKGLVSLVCYALAVVLAFLSPVISDLLILLVSLIWFIPDKRIEKYL